MVHPTLDHYTLFAIDGMRVRNLQSGDGDLGVNLGAFVARGSLAASAQIVADRAELPTTAQCGALLANSAAGTAPGCALAGAVPQPIIADVPAACGFPNAFPACDAAASLVVGAGRTLLPPGVYGDVLVKSAGALATLELTGGGSYVFCSLRVGRHGEVLFRGASQIHVAQNLKLGVQGRVAPVDGLAAPRDGQMFVTGKSITLDRDSRMLATLCAPNAKLKLNHSRIEGSAVAKEIRAAGSTVLRPYEESRAACASHNPLRNLYFGDLHVHTALSFDANAFDVRTTPAEAYGFARGAAVALPPLDVSGVGTRTIQLERPLDFAAVTDHSEYLGEVEECTTPGSPNYGSATCTTYRGEEYAAVRLFGFPLVVGPPRFRDVCAPGVQECLTQGAEVWQRVQDAAEQAYDRTASCAFTSFVAYEYTSAKGTSTHHRNVVFRNERVPYPTTFFEQPEPQGLWSELAATCRDAATGCDVLAIPHNSNESNGNMFFVEYPGTHTLAGERGQAQLRGAMEPLVEIYQHKGDSECMNGLSGVIGASDEQCDFEKDPRPFQDCGDGTGGGGVSRFGCFSRLDFVRNVLLAGLQEDARLGVNPYRLGIIASTDTHNGTPGAVDEAGFVGHRGIDDDTPAKQLGNGVLTPGGIQFSPGGIVGVWAEENSRPGIFDALRRREVFGTSGPRIAVRFFGGWNLPAGLCSDPDMLADAYAAGVPMGSLLDEPSGPATAPSFLVSAQRDPGTLSRPGAQLQRIQIVKGWIEQGQSHQQVFDVAGDPDNGATVDVDTCVASGPGDDSLCAVWIDPGFDPSQHAYYYVRVLENPTCRWSTITCNGLAPVDRPSACSDPGVEKTIQERAWSSPIWYRPGA
jgi:hypothetical protein